jgi:hypothetical protein
MEITLKAMQSRWIVGRSKEYGRACDDPHEDFLRAREEFPELVDYCVVEGFIDATGAHTRGWYSIVTTIPSGEV